MPHKKKRNGKIRWYGSVTINGHRSTRVFDSKRDAVDWEAEVRMSSPVVEQVVTELPTLAEWSRDYLSFAAKFSDKVVNEKFNAFKRFLDSLAPNQRVDKLTAGQALDFLQQQARKRSGNSANKDRKNLMAAWSWGVSFRNFPERNPFRSVPEFPHDEQGHYVPPEEDFWKVWEVSKEQDRTLLLTFLHTAARRGEVYRLTWSDVDFDKRLICLRTRKRHSGSLEKDWVPMTDHLLEVLKVHAANSQSGSVFVQPKGRFRGRPYTENRGFPQRLCERAGVVPFGCHGIRGLTASILARNDVPLVAIQQILRHRKLNTTERYIRGLEPVRPHLKCLGIGLSG